MGQSSLKREVHITMMIQPNKTVVIYHAPPNSMYINTPISMYLPWRHTQHTVESLANTVGTEREHALRVGVPVSVPTTVMLFASTSAEPDDPGSMVPLSHEGTRK